MLTDIYKIFDQLRLNPSSIGIAVVFMTVLWIFALREIFSWLMKTNQIAKQFHGADSCARKASIAACPNFASRWGGAPATPTAPMQTPSTSTGSPPSIGV